MVGGVIIGLTKREDEIHVNVADCPHYPRHGLGDECPRPDTCCVYTDGVRVQDSAPANLQIGDLLWWQGGLCYWTPRANRQLAKARGGVDYDIKLTKLGYSH